MKSTDDVKYIRITDFDDDGIPLGHEFVTAEVIEEDARLQHNDVLFARSGATAGKTYIHNKEIGPAVFAGYCIRFKFDAQRVLPKFVYYYTKTTRYQAWVRSIQRPAGQPNINKEEFKAFIIPVPDTDIQAKLVSELEVARSTTKNKLAQSDDLLDGFDNFILDALGLTAPSQEKRMCFAVRLGQIDGALNAERYAGLRLAQPIQGTVVNKVAEILETKIAPSKVAPNANWDWIRIDDLENHPLTIDKMRTAIGSEIDGTFFEVSENDILLARLGPTIQNAKFVLCPQTKRRTVASGEFLVLRCRGGWNPAAVLWVLRTKLLRNLMYSKARGGTPSRYRLHRDDLAAMPFPEMNSHKQNALIEEINRRILRVQHLRAEAVAEWTAAKTRFEQQLLGTGKP
jgi:type I restriction enzyme S subunit